MTSSEHGDDGKADHHMVTQDPPIGPSRSNAPDPQTCFGVSGRELKGGCGVRVSARFKGYGAVLTCSGIGEIERVELCCRSCVGRHCGLPRVTRVVGDVGYGRLGA